MNQRIAEKFRQVKQQGRAALVTYIMAYVPEREVSQKLLESLPAAGADIIELGMPFSDPMADGPVIQKAGIKALQNGAKITGILDMVRQFRQKDATTPVILMGYYNPVHNYGPEKFAKDASHAGVDGLLVVDLPPEESGQLQSELDKNGIDFIRLVTPTSGDGRIKTIVNNAGGFIYYIAVAGVTGTKSATGGDIKRAVGNICKFTKLPVAVGFGVKTPEDVKNIAACTDAVVVGSAIVERTLADSPDILSDTLEFVSQLASGTVK